MSKLSNITTKLASTDFLNNEEFENVENLEAFTAHLVRNILQEWLENSEENLPKPQTHCGGCGKYANYVSKRVGFSQSRFGLLRYKRSYYVCPHCHQSTCPLDERLDPVESLARLRAKVADGKPLPVADIAKDWGLGSLKTGAPILSTEIDQPKVSVENINTNQLHGPHAYDLRRAVDFGAVS